jgi:uncharacterized membrane protein YphA (DoxX/SURF4 family)
MNRAREVTTFLLRVISGFMFTQAVAYFKFHQPGGTWPIQNHGEPAVLFCFLFLYFAAHGAGPWSIDQLIARVRPASPVSLLFGSRARAVRLTSP